MYINKLASANMLHNTEAHQNWPTHADTFDQPSRQPCIATSSLIKHGLPENRKTPQDAAICRKTPQDAAKRLF